MEKIKIFKKSVLEKLENDIKKNTKLYENMQQNPNWLKEEFEKQEFYNYATTSLIEWEPPQLIIGGPETDKENARRIFEALKNLTPVQAVQAELWAYLTHIVYPEYMATRWNVKDKDNDKDIDNKTEEGFIKSRYFATRGGKGTVRNGISRLWWAGKWGYDGSREEPYELVDVIFDKQETYLHVSERAYNRNEDLLKQILEVIKDKDLNSTEIKKLFKEMNSYGSIKHLDSLQEKEAREATEEIIASFEDKELLEVK